MHQEIQALLSKPLHDWLDEHAHLSLHESITNLRDQQIEALSWLLERREPYLFLNAPTGSGKTLLNGVAGTMLGERWTYGVHTKMLQDQVARTFTDLPIIKGRANFPCLIGQETHGREIDASDGICAAGEWCEHTGRPSRDGDLPSFECPYYEQRNTAMDSNQRVANYAMIINQAKASVFTSMLGKGRTQTLLADEAHNIEDVVSNQVSFRLSERTFRRLGIDLPWCGQDLMRWKAWAVEAKKQLPPVRGGRERPDFGLITAHELTATLSRLDEKDVGQWLVREVQGNFPAVTFEPVWGREFVMKWLFGHDAPPESADIYELGRTWDPGVRKVIFTSATLMGAEFVADLMGLPEGSWAYLDLPSTFPIANRPIMYAPVERMNAGKMSTKEGRAKMQDAMDRLIDFYILNGKASGVIHSVSHKYRDNILQESRWRDIMATTPEEHEARVGRGEPSVLVAANVTEGWDGVDDLCRFVLIPKVPFPNLGDERTRVRKEEDPRSFDHKALVAIVQGAGRGVRHGTDFADTWILDGAWKMLFGKARKKDWLPDAFMSAYHQNVALP